MKTFADLALARDLEGGVFYSAHVIRRRPSGSSPHGLPCMASRLRQRGAVLRETLPSPPREGVTSVQPLSGFPVFDFMPPWGGSAAA